MGYLTTLTIYNDGIDLLNDPEKAAKFGRDVYLAALQQRGQDIAVGSHVNLAHVQRARHADDHTVYVHAGNCLTEIAPFGHDDELSGLCRRVPEFAATLERTLARSLANLRDCMAKTRKPEEP